MSDSPSASHIQTHQRQPLDASMGVVIVHRHWLTSPDDLDLFLAACREPEMALRGEGYEHLVRLWANSGNPLEPRQVTTIIGLSDVGANSPLIKSPAWKRFIKTTKPLVEPPDRSRQDVRVLSDVGGLALLPETGERAA